MSEPELSRPVRADTLGAAPRVVQIEAKPGERQALARRFGLRALDSLEAEVSLHRANEDIVGRGRLSAQVVQACVITGEPVPARIEEEFDLLFRPEPTEGAGEDEVELGEDELDVMFYDGALVDAGEAVAQTLALNLEPYPRAGGAAEALQEAGVQDEGSAGPFGALAGLKDKLGN